MKKILFILIPVLSISLLLGGYFYIGAIKDSAEKENSQITAENNYQENESEENETEKYRQRAAYNEKFNVPHELYLESVKKVMTAPSEENYSDFVSTNFWSCIGPFGLVLPGTPGFTHTGRCMDYHYDITNGSLVGTSQGGLWKAVSTPIPLTDNIPVLSVSTFDVHQFNPANIVIGSGDGWSGNAPNTDMGAWVTTNTGNTWTPSVFDFSPGRIYKIRYSGLGGIWYLSGAGGCFRTTDNGFNWVRILPYPSSDFDFNGFNLYTAVVNAGSNNGIWKSTNSGGNFIRLTGLDAVVPGGQGVMGFINISVANSLPSRIYIYITNGCHIGVFKSENSGTSWQNTNCPDVMYGCQGAHNSCIAVNPLNPDLVLVGSGTFARTSNNGSSWQAISYEFESSFHVDITRIVWNSNGSVTATSDGGVHSSTNGGLNWTSNNNLPVAQFYDIDVAVRNNQLWVLAAAQDNSAVLVKNASLNSSGTWSLQIFGNDGGDACILEQNPDYMLVSRWSNGDKISRTTNAGVSWTEIFSHGSNLAVRLDDDRVGAGAWFYRSALGVVSYSQDLGITWQPVGGGGNFASSVYNLSVCKYTNSTSVVYITTSMGNRNIWVYQSDVGAWLNWVAGLPDIQFGKVAVHPRNYTTAYALVATPGTPEKVFKTLTRGLNWTNVTGDLATVAGSGILVRDLVPHPTNDNLLYIGTNFGCWRTTNGGVNWQRWNYGMPVANDIRDMEFIDSINVNKFYVIAGSYGRGVWTRDASGDDPVTGVQNNFVPSDYSLYQNYPNPFNPSTTIKFDLPVSDFVTIKVYDIAGREVTTIIDKKMSAGTHELKFDGSKLASGVYFYRLETPRNIEVKKMILLK